MAGELKIGNVVFADTHFYQIPSFGIVFNEDFWKECVRRAGRMQLLHYFEKRESELVPVRVLGIRAAGSVLEEEDKIDESEPNDTRVINYTYFQKDHTRLVAETDTDLEYFIGLLHMVRNFSGSYLREVLNEVLIFQKYLKGEYEDTDPKSLGHGEKLFVELLGKGVPR